MGIWEFRTGSIISGMWARFAQIAILGAASILALHHRSYAQDAGSTTDTSVADKCAPYEDAQEQEETKLPVVSIAEVTFVGSLELPLAEQEKIALEIRKRTTGNDLELVVDGAAERARAGWQNNGYFKVQVNADFRVLTSSPAAERIALTFHVNEGMQYRLSDLTFKNNKVICDAKSLRSLFPINDGDIFSREKIAKGLEDLRKTYAEYGYINFTSVPDTTFDDANQAVSLEIDMDEGKQFYVESVTALGLNQTEQLKFKKSSLLKRGDIYNGRLWEMTIVKNAALFPDCDCSETVSRTVRRLDEKLGTVALTVDFRSCPSN